MSLLILGIVAAVILIVYIGAILVFTPDEKDDRYVLNILQFAFRMHDKSIGRRGLRKNFFDFFSIAFLIFDYNILRNRNKMASGHNKFKEV